MSIAFSILLLMIFALIFWVFRTHKNAVLRAMVIAVFFAFCVIFGSSFDSIMGWGAKPKYLPEIVTIQHVHIQEPSPIRGDPGGIFIVIRGAPQAEDLFLKTFGYHLDFPEPRLFKLPYSRKLHEQMQGIMAMLQQGQTVTGKMGKMGEGEPGEGEPGEGEPGENGGRPGDGEMQEGQEEGGSESLSGFEFHILPPNYFLRKN